MKHAAPLPKPFRNSRSSKRPRLGSTEFDARTTLLTIVSQAMSVAAGLPRRTRELRPRPSLRKSAGESAFYFFDKTG